MKRVIVDYAKLTNEILNLLVEKFPDGYDDSDVIRFRNAKNELIEAVEVRTDETIYLVKISTKLSDRIENYDEDDELEIEPIADIAIDDEDNEEEDEDKPEYKDDALPGDDDEDDDQDDTDIAADEEDEDED